MDDRFYTVGGFIVTASAILLALIFGALAVYFWKRPRPVRNQLLVEYSHNPLPDLDADVSGTVVTSSDEIRVRRPGVLVVRVTNRGPSDLEKSAFDGGSLIFHVHGTYTHDILSGDDGVKIEPMREEDPDPFHTRLTVQPRLMVPGERWRLAMLTDDSHQNRGTFSVTLDAHLAGFTASLKHQPGRWLDDEEDPTDRAEAASSKAANAAKFSAIAATGSTVLVAAAFANWISSL